MFGHIYVAHSVQLKEGNVALVLISGITHCLIVSFVQCEWSLHVHVG